MLYCIYLHKNELSLLLAENNVGNDLELQAISLRIRQFFF